MLPWSALAGGFITGKYQRGNSPSADSRAGSDKALYQWTSAEYAESDRNWQTINLLVGIARETGATPAQVAMHWLMNRPGVTAPISGARTLAQLKNDLPVVDLVLSAAATSALEAVSASQSSSYCWRFWLGPARAPWKHPYRRLTVSLLADRLILWGTLDPRSQIYGDQRCWHREGLRDFGGSIA